MIWNALPWTLVLVTVSTLIAFVFGSSVRRFACLAQIAEMDPCAGAIHADALGRSRSTCLR